MTDSRNTNFIEFRGASTDTKPTGSGIPEGSTFYEHDTTKYFMFNGTTWVEQFQMEEE